MTTEKQQSIKLFNTNGEPLDIKYEDLHLHDNNVIIAPEIIVPFTPSEEKFFSGDIVKHTYLSDHGGDIVEESEIICLTRAVETICIPFGGSLGLEKIGNVIEDIKALDMLTDEKTRDSIEFWLFTMNHQKIKEKLYGTNGF